MATCHDDDVVRWVLLDWCPLENERNKEGTVPA